MNTTQVVILLTSVMQRAETGHAVRFSTIEVKALEIAINDIEGKQKTLG